MKTRIYTVYAKDDDMTFIMRETRNGVNKVVEVVGFYFGEPDEDATEEFRDSLFAVFGDDELEECEELEEVEE